MKNNKKVLVLGSKGMLGNAVYSYLVKNPNFETYGTVKPTQNGTETTFPFLVSTDVSKLLARFLEKIYPDYVINCIGFIRPEETLKDYKNAILVNSYFPNILSLVCQNLKCNLIHISTDCVFDGKKGSYTTTDLPNETKIYGLSKYLGEVRKLSHLTIRTSLIGWEKEGRKNLLNWFLSQNGPVKGYSNVFWNGVTTLTLAKIIEKIMLEEPPIKNSLIQIGSNKINKYDLLKIFKTVFAKDIEIIKDPSIKSDKTLVPSLEQEEHFSALIPNIKKQLIELKSFYDL